jgi:hypothetical protein
MPGLVEFPDPLRELRLRHAERLDELLKEHLAGARRRSLGRNTHVTISSYQVATMQLPTRPADRVGSLQHWR